MRFLLAAAAVLFAAAPAVGQAAPPAQRGPTAGERVLIVAGALGGGFVPSTVFPEAAPLGVVVGAYGVGRFLGFDASLGSVAVDGAIGTAVGLGVGTVAVYALDGGSDLGAALVAVGLGFTAGAVTTALLYGGQKAVAVAPAAFEAPGGERAAGVALRVVL